MSRSALFRGRLSCSRTSISWVGPSCSRIKVRTSVSKLNRSFTTSNLFLQNASAKDRSYFHLKVNQDRLMNNIHRSCQWGIGQRWGSGENETGMSRLALSDADRSARDWFVQVAESLKCKVQVDNMGNIFAVRKGKRDGAPTFIGSHLDTQPSGGRYDGILGVTAGLEALQVLEENSVETEFPVGVVNWTNEEGARFPISMMSSGVWAGAVPLETAHSCKEVGGTKTFFSELKRIGYLGKTEASHKAIKMGGHFELHIEQGPILEASNKKIGIVEGVQAYRWYTIDVTGSAAHTGTTDFPNRADALQAASKMILHSHRLATRHKCLASTGSLILPSSSFNTVPESVKFSLDVRSRSNETVLLMEKQLKEDFSKIAQGVDVDNLNDDFTAGKPCQVEWQLVMDSEATKFHPDCIDCVEQSAGSLFSEKTGQLTEKMISGAGHDSVNASKHCPTSMIFIPCRDGVSHNPVEFSSPEDCALGAQVLLGAVLRFDSLREK